MFKHSTKIVCVLVFLTFAFFGCSIESVEDFDDTDKFRGFYCPPCNETVTWDSYGKCSIMEFGSDSWGWKLESDCGWQIYDGHEGGYGDTLELYSCGNEGVIFIWAYQKFMSFELAEGWTGKTAEGIRIGASLNHFLKVYPGFVKDYKYGNKLRYSLGSYKENIWVRAVFVDKKLVELLMH